MIEQKIRQSIVLDRVIPEYVVSEYPKFVEFVRSYYKWMESPGNTIDQMNKLISNKDIDTVTSDKHSFFILDTFLSSIPKTLELDYAHLLNNIRAFYSEKGTADSIKAFFRLLLETTKPNVIVVKFSGLEDTLVGQQIRGSNSGALSTVIRSTRVSPGSNYVSLSLTYSSDPRYKSRYFTSADEVILEDNTRIPISISDFNVDIFYPKSFILRTSDGEYKQEYRCRIKLEAGLYRSYSNKTFTTSSGSIGRIDRQSYSVMTKNGFDYYDLTLSFSLRKSWSSNERLFVDGVGLQLVPVFTGVEIKNGGLGYTKGETFQITSGGKVVGSIEVGDVNRSRIDSISVLSGGDGYSVGDRFNFKYSTGVYGGGSVRSVNNGVISDIRIDQAKKNSDEFPEVEFRSGNNTAKFVVTGPNVGSITGVHITDVGADVDQNSTILIPQKPFPLRRAELSVRVGTLYVTRKGFVDDRGTPSSHFRVQDNFYWQDFSYVVKYNHPIDFSLYLDLYKSVVHPSGTKVFFEVRRSSDSSSMELGPTLDGSRKIIKEDSTHETIGSIAHETIGSKERIKDTNPMRIYQYEQYTRESLKTLIMDNQLFFNDLSSTIDSFSTTRTLHEYTTSIDMKEMYVKYLDGSLNISDVTIVTGV